MLTPKERTMLIETAKQHPDLLPLLELVANGEPPVDRRQLQRSGHAVGSGYAGRMER